MTFRMMLPLAAAAALAACSGTDTSGTASESLAASDLRARPVPVYLALGDSVAFGWRDSLADSTVPWVFAGYPQLLALGLRLSLLDAACPSETSGSFLSGAGSGCQVYRQDHALHVSYPGSQLAYALEVAASRRLRLVTLQLGVNELELMVGACAGDAACIGERLPALLQETATHVATAVGALRQASDPRPGRCREPSPRPPGACLGPPRGRVLGGPCARPRPGLHEERRPVSTRARTAPAPGAPPLPHSSVRGTEPWTD